MFADIRGSEVMGFIKKQIGEATFCRKSDDQVKEGRREKEYIIDNILPFTRLPLGVGRFLR